MTWYKDSVKMFETDKVLMTQKSRTWSLKLTSVERVMFGNYTCVASNNLGTNQATTTLSGQSGLYFHYISPSKPLDLLHRGLSPDELVQTFAEHN